MKVKKKARAILAMIYKTQGLMGVPIWTEGDGPGYEHWTRLLLRRLNSEVHIRYHDSSTHVNPCNISMAQQLLDSLKSKAKPEWRTMSRQTGGT